MKDSAKGNATTVAVPAELSVADLAAMFGQYGFKLVFCGSGKLKAVPVGGVK